MTNALVKLEKAHALLAEVKEAPEAKAIADMAAAAKEFARKQRLGRESIQYANAVEVDAKTRMAECLNGNLNPGTRTKGGDGRRSGGSPGGSVVEPPGIPTLESLGIGKKESADGAFLLRLRKRAPELYQAVREMSITLGKAKRKIKDADRKREFEAAAKKAKSKGLAEVADIQCCDMASLLGSLQDLDAIITDPPYPKEYLPLYGELARLAAKAMKPSGVLAVMCGQSYLPEILAAMACEIPYRWTLAYLTPGGQAVQLWKRKVNTFWKPVLLFGGAGEWLGDVIKSDTNDNDKRFHGWGQSDSGIGRLVEALTKPGSTVCDPFLGGGTTAVASVRLARRFIGCDVDAKAVETSRMRIELALCNK